MKVDVADLKAGDVVSWGVSGSVARVLETHTLTERSEPLIRVELIEPLLRSGGGTWPIGTVMWLPAVLAERLSTEETHPVERKAERDE